MSLEAPELGWGSTAVAEYGPRAVRQSESSRKSEQTFRVLAAACLAMGGYLLYADTSELSDLRTNGKVLQATVVEVQTHPGKRESYTVRYRYTLGWETVTDEEKFSNAGPPPSVGATIPVVALPNRPGVHRYGWVTDETVSYARMKWISFTLLFAGLFEVFSLMYRSLTKGEMRILRDYVAVPAVCLDVTKLDAAKMDTESALTHVVTVSYRSLEGGQALWTQQVSSATTERFRVGEPTTLLIDPANPTKIRDLDSLTHPTVV